MKTGKIIVYMFVLALSSGLLKSNAYAVCNIHPMGGSTCTTQDEASNVASYLISLYSSSISPDCNCSSRHEADNMRYVIYCYTFTFVNEVKTCTSTTIDGPVVNYGYPVCTASGSSCCGNSDRCCGNPDPGCGDPNGGNGAGGNGGGDGGGGCPPGVCCVSGGGGVTSSSGGSSGADDSGVVGE